MRQISIVCVLGVVLLAACGGGEAGIDGSEVGKFCHGLADGTPCDDGNPCTEEDRCGLGLCMGRAAEDGAECDDQDLCTSTDQCLAGMCVGEALDCAASGNQCSVGICDPISGACVADPLEDGTECSDGNQCTLQDECVAGLCEGVSKDCALPDKPCLVGACSPLTGDCVSEPRPDGDGCEDGDLCTTGDVCADGECGGEPVDCSDLGGPCSAGKCSPLTGLCVQEQSQNGTVCDDGNSCTDGETCATGLCGGGVHSADGSPCDDDDLCTPVDTCVAGICTGEPKDCSTGIDNACVKGVCNPDTGDCEMKPVADPACVCWQAPDGTECDDGSACTLGDTCKDDLCIGEATDCALFNDECNEGVCDPESGLCVKKPAWEGKECNDAANCTESDACVKGVCTGVQVSCSEFDAKCAVGICDEANGQCQPTPLTNGTPCDDSDICSGHDECSDGVCMGEIDLCKACFGGDSGQGCNDGNACSVNTVCILAASQLVCMGEQKDCSEQVGPCQFGYCDPETGDCIATPVPDGISCNDEDKCTFKDACVAGECKGVAKDCALAELPCAVGACNPVTGACSIEVLPDNEPCDDADPCTLDDACEKGICLGEEKDCAGVEGQCMLGKCNPEDGECGIPYVDGTTCDDLNVCTTGDACLAGECVGDDICFCMDKADGTACDDGFACTVNDKCVDGGCAGSAKDCSALDKACLVGACMPETGMCEALPVQDGSPCDDGQLCTTGDSCLAGQCGGAPKDCSSLTGQCGAGVCKAADGKCALEAGPDGIPCDDEEVCTGSDSCVAGLCVGGLNLCGSCLGQEAGTDCDDSDACTVETTCVEMSGLLVCQGKPMDCAGLDSQCAVGACDPGAGQCVPKAKKDGLVCDDKAPCTEADACTAGFCKGKQINMCGETPAFCEAPGANDKMAQAVPLALGGDTITIMAWISPAGETDWYTVMLEKGQLLSVESRPHCGSTLDTQIGVYEPDGMVQLAVADDGGDGAFTLIKDVEVQTSGVHYIGLTAYSASGTATYLLEVTAYFPPPCAGDQDCVCKQLKCELAGPDAGKCVPAMQKEAEPNDLVGEANPVQIGSQYLGKFGMEGDVDWYSVELTSEGPVTIGTEAFCSEVVNPKIQVFDGQGWNVLAADSSGGGSGYALVSKFQAPSSGKYLVRVDDDQALTGSYVLFLNDARCKTDADCGCVDQKCNGSVDNPGQCIPLLHAPEAVAPDSPPAPLKIDQRLHAYIDQPGDKDSFAISLAPGKYDFNTLSYCDSDTDTEMLLFAPGNELVATDEDSGDGFFAAVKEFTVPQPAVYIIKVSAYGAGMGDYIVRVQNSKNP